MSQPQGVVGAPSQLEENVRQVTRMLMKRDGITLPMLALRLGVSRTAVSNRLGGPVPYSGKKPFTVAEVGVLGELFGLPPSVFLSGPLAMLGEAAEDSMIVPGSIKKLRGSTGVSRDVTGGHLPLVAA